MPLYLCLSLCMGRKAIVFGRGWRDGKDSPGCAEDRSLDVELVVVESSSWVGFVPWSVGTDVREWKSIRMSDWTGLAEEVCKVEAAKERRDPIRA